MTERDADAFRRLSRRLSTGATIAFSVMALLMVAGLAMAAWRAEVLGVRRLWLLMLMGAPVGFHLWALWNLRALFANLAERGLMFDPTWEREITRAGWGLTLGGGLTLAAAPLILQVIPAQGAVGFVAGAPSAITMCLVGLSLIALAVLVRRGRSLQAEKAALETTLSEFV